MASHDAHFPEHIRETGDMLLHKGSSYAQERLLQMNAQQQLHAVLTTDPAQRMKLIALLDKPKQIIRALPEEELYWTIKEAGTKRSLPLLRRSTQDQTQFIFDIEFWEGDNLSPKRILQWLKVLAQCGERKIVEWFKHFEFDFLAATLKQFIAVYKPVEGTDDYGESIEPLPTYTLDGIYFVHFLRKDAEHTLNILFRTLIAADNRLYATIMEAVIWGIDDELLYQSFDRVQMRLEEKGIPDYDEARSIYRYVPPSKIDSLPRREQVAKNKDSAVKKSYLPIHVGSAQKLFLSQVLEQIDTFSDLEELSLHLAAVANKIMVADHAAMHNYNSYKMNIEKTAGIINIGLEKLSDCNIDRGAEVLRSLWLESIFTVGWSTVIDLTRRAKSVAVIFEQLSEWGINILDFPYREMMSGLQNDRPQFFEGVSNTDLHSYRHFQSLRDIAQTDEMLDTLKNLAALITEKLEIRFDINARSPLVQTAFEHITIKSILMTSYAHKVLSGIWRFAPLDFSSAQLFFNALLAPGTPTSDIDKNAIAETLLDTIHSDTRIPFTENERAHLGTFITFCVDSLITEYTEATESGYFDIIVFKTLLIEHIHF